MGRRVLRLDVLFRPGFRIGTHLVVFQHFGKELEEGHKGFWVLFIGGLSHSAADQVGSDC